MRIAALYDIHGNLPALEAVLSGIRREDVDQIVVGGDVFPGPMPRETIECLLESNLPVSFIRGNGDREVLSFMSGTETDWYRAARPEWQRPIEWTARQLDARLARLIAGWPLTREADHPEPGRVLFCHATPQNDTDSGDDVPGRRRVRNAPRVEPAVSGGDARRVQPRELSLTSPAACSSRSPG